LASSLRTGKTAFAIMSVAIYVGMSEGWNTSGDHKTPLKIQVYASTIASHVQARSFDSMFDQFAHKLPTSSD